MSLQNFTLDGDLKIGQYKTINCKVQLEVSIIEHDDWANPDIPIDYSMFVDGVRVIGELSFDTSPIDYGDKHPVQKSAIGELILLEDLEKTTKINVLFFEKSGMQDIIPRKIKRYFWQFFAIGKPHWDKIGIFPTNYRGKNMNRIFACTDFRGHWPTGVSAVVIANDKSEAKHILDTKLNEAGILIEGMRGDGNYTLTEIDIQKKGAVVLNDGCTRHCGIV